MDTQVNDSPDTEGEWAVDRILSHAGSKTDSVFEIKEILHGFPTTKLLITGTN